MKLADLGKPIPPEYYHDPSLQNEDGQTVAMILASHNQEIPKEWYHDPRIADNKGLTVAFYQAVKGKVPDKQWEHNKFTRVQDTENVFCSIKNILEEYSIEVPEQWNYEAEYDFDNTMALLQSENGQIPDDQFYHDPCQTNQQLYTVALNLFVRRIIPPKKWNHDPNFYYYEDTTACQFLNWIGSTPIPNDWFDTTYSNKQKNDDIFEKYLYGEKPDVSNYDKAKQNCDGWTLAMIHVFIYKEVPPDELYHNPEIQNKFGDTVAMLLLQQDIPVPPKWQHKPEIYNRYKMTFALQCAERKIIPPKEWIHDSSIEDDQNYTVALWLSHAGIAPPEVWNHDPLKVTKRGNTVAILLAAQGTIPPQHWHHQPDRFCKFYDDKNDVNLLTQSMTVAMLLASNGVIPSKEWHHDPTLKDEIHHETVGLMLSKHGIIPPEEWMHDITIKDRYVHSIYDNLIIKGYIFKDGKYISNCQTEKLDDICQICFSEGNIDFVISNCEHRICLQCFQQLQQNDDHYRCPICRRYNWYQKIEKSYISYDDYDDYSDYPTSSYNSSYESVEMSYD